MTLREALAYAREHQPSLRVAAARMTAASADTKVPRAQWQPTVGATAQILAGTANNTTTSFVSNRYVDLPRIGATPVTTSGVGNPYPSTLAALGIRQEAFDFGRIAAQAAATDAAVEVERASVEGERLDVDVTVREAFYAVQAARQVVMAAEGAYARARTQADAAQAGVAAGLRSPIDRTRATADLMRFDAGRVQARGGLSDAQAVFAGAVGLPVALLDAAGDPEATTTLPSLAEALQRAADRDPTIRIALARIRQQEAQTRAVGAEQRPDLWLTGTVSGRAGGTYPSSGTSSNVDGWLPNVPNWSVAVVFGWPLYDGVSQAREHASRAREQVAREQLSVARQRQIAALHQAYDAVRVAQEVLPALQRAVDAARANQEQADARFRQGLGTSVETADATALLTQAEIDFALGRFRLARSRALLGRVIAEPL